MAQLKPKLPAALFGVRLRELIPSNDKNLFLAKGRDGFFYAMELAKGIPVAYRKLAAKHLAA